MKRQFLLLFVLTFFVSCVGWKQVYRFAFYNKSNKDIYIIVDLNSVDNVITEGSMTHHIDANAFKFIDNKNDWIELVKDSLHIYVLDGARILLPTAPITKEHIESINSEILLDRMTILKSEIKNMGSYYYP